MDLRRINNTRFTVRTVYVCKSLGIRTVHSAKKILTQVMIGVKAGGCIITRKVIDEIANFKNDPVLKCDLYKKEGCSHIDGMLCDFPNCEMNNDFLKAK